MRSGIYAVASLAGAPLESADCRALELAPSDKAALNAVDLEEQGSAAACVRTGTEMFTFLGALDDPKALAVALEQDFASPAELALAAYRKWGEQAGAHMPGLWSFVHWDDKERALTVALSRNRRDNVFVASCDGFVAVAPDVVSLFKLSFVTPKFDELGFSYAVSPGTLRRYADGRTPFQDISRIEPGMCVTFTSSGSRRTRIPDPPAWPWLGSFDDATQALEAELRTILRRLMAQHETVAVLLSGGLDSTLLVWLAAEERLPGQRVICLTSVAPANSGLADERTIAKSVADALGLSIFFVTPQAHVNVFQPRPEIFAHTGATGSSPRHYLYDALFDAARAHGATAILDGSGGEMTVTGTAEIGPWKSRLRGLRNLVKRGLSRPRPDNGFFVQLAGDFLARQPPNVSRHMHRIPRPFHARAATPIGIAQALFLLREVPNTVPDGGLLRHYPFREGNLHQIFGGMPAGFTRWNGTNRAIARAILDTHVPEAVRMQPKGLPFSPDYARRIATDAPSIVRRITDYRAVHAHHVLDLDWLQNAALHASGTCTTKQQFGLQSTAHAAEFLVWSAQRGVSL